ncbi:MAG: hypothetical protein JF617_18340, partial [Burkholderiales bacterium]|nr:hypothetical protein [Burkholderiales bacterium]
MNWSDLRPCCCVLGLALAGTAAQAQPAGPAAASTQHATRSGAAFSDLEEALLRAQ